MWGNNYINIDYAHRNRARYKQPQRSRWHPFHMGEEKIEEFTTIGDNELLLGYSEHDNKEPVTIHFDWKKRITMVIQGDNGTGKSIEGKNLVIDQLHRRWNRNALIVDPKGDMRTLGQKNKIKAFRRLLANFDIFAKAYHAKYISPLALEVSGAWANKPDGLLYKLGMDNWLKLPKAVRYDIVKKAWTKDDKAPAVERSLLDIFLGDSPPTSPMCHIYENQVGKDYKDPRNCSCQNDDRIPEIVFTCDNYKLGLGNFKDPKNCSFCLQTGYKQDVKCFAHLSELPAKSKGQITRNMHDYLKNELQIDFSKNKDKCFAHMIEMMDKPPPNLMNMLLAYVKTDVLGDKGANYAKLLAENGILVLETGLSDPEKDTLADIFVEDGIMGCLQDRTLSVTSENKQGNLHAPFTLFFEEADVFAGKHKSTSSLLTQLLTKYREIDPEKKSKGILTYGCDCVFLSQHIHTLSDIIVKEIDWIIMPKLTDERDGEKLRMRGLDTVDLDDLVHLEFGQHPNTFVAINKQGAIIPFKPLPTASFM